MFTQISGGPESAIYKSTDAGQSWDKAMSGIGGRWVGRIGMDISPADPDVLYAVVEGDDGSEGFYRSTDRAPPGRNEATTAPPATTTTKS
ncbi:MAG: hypothetical protein U5K31_09485 [Balneolaceae bacterium]|nr:hypothetical protein [Balneolaceae bacterium]